MRRILHRSPHERRQRREPFHAPNIDRPRIDPRPLRAELRPVVDDEPGIDGCARNTDAEDVRSGGERDDQAVRSNDDGPAELEAMLGSSCKVAQELAQIGLGRDRVAISHPEGVRLGRRRAFRFEIRENGVVQSGRPISQWWPNGSSTRPCRQPYGWSAIGKTTCAPSATARAATASGSSTLSWIRTDVPPSFAGLTLNASGTSSTTMNGAPSSASSATMPFGLSARDSSVAPNARL